MLSDKERNFLKILIQKDVHFLIVGLSAATMQGAPVVTQDVDLWFENFSDPRIAEAIKTAGGVYVPPIPSIQNPPCFAGDDFHFLDIVTHMSGLLSFEEEYPHAHVLQIDGVPLKVLPLARIIHSKKTANRLKDKMVLPALEAALEMIDAETKNEGDR